jgi:alpha-beta hydrolase superfamily lysophospholipase
MKQYRFEHRSKQPKASLLIVHGLGEHIHRYDDVFDDLNQHGLNVYGFDHIGHGRSGGVQGHIDHWSQYTRGLDDAVQWWLAADDYPKYIWAHSMGTVITLDWLEQSPLASKLSGVALSGPVVEANASPVLIWLAKVLSRAAPRLKLSHGLDINGISSIPSEVSRYLADPLVFDRVSARWGAEMLSAMSRVKTALDQIKCPILIGHGTADSINLPENSAYIERALVNCSVELKWFETARHELHHDISREQWLATLVAFVESHCPS